MISNLFWMLNYIRENLLEKFILPELGISYWEFCIYLAMAAVVITVLINSVKVSGTVSSNAKSEKAYRNILRERERVKYDERQKLKNNNNDSGGFNSVFKLSDELLSRINSEDS